MDNNQLQSQIRENETKGRGLFYGVIAVATFIIMAVGATFAYFTATAQGASSSVQTRSTTLDLRFISYNSAWRSANLIPAADNIVVHSFMNQNDTTLGNNKLNGPDVDGKSDNLNNTLCKDDEGSSICSVYVFQVYNSNSSKQSLSIKLGSTNNEFTNLWVMGFALSLPSDATAYNGTDNHNQEGDPKFLTGAEEAGTDTSGLIAVTKGDSDASTPLRMGASFDSTNWSNDEYFPVYPNRVGTVKTLWKVTNNDNTARKSSIVPVAVNGSEVLVADQFEVDGGKVGTFALVLYIKETGDNQTAADGGETGRGFEGYVKVSTDDNPDNAITGNISGIDVNDINNIINATEPITSGDSGSSGTEPEPGQTQP